jgi:hypothetical protein
MTDVFRMLETPPQSEGGASKQQFEPRAKLHLGFEPATVLRKLTVAAQPPEHTK